jgi:hypothetical protein
VLSRTPEERSWGAGFERAAGFLAVVGSGLACCAGFLVADEAGLARAAGFLAAVVAVFAALRGLALARAACFLGRAVSVSVGTGAEFASALTIGARLALRR